MLAVKHTDRRVPKNIGARYAKLLAAHERAEAKLARAMRAWDKTRTALRRAERKLDQAWNAEAEGHE